MGAGGLNGELRNQSDQVDAIFRYHFAFPHDQRATGTAQQDNFTSSATTTQSFASNSAYSSANTDSTEMVCYLCSVNFTLFKRKSMCRGCKKTLCSNCFSQGLSSREQASRCITCRALAAPVIYKDFLRGLKIKDLQDYLRNKNVATSQCKEKRDLVELILQYSQARSQPQVPRPAQPTNTNPQRDTSNPYSGLSAGLTVGNRTTDQSEEERTPTNKEVSRRTIDDLTAIEQVDDLSVKELKTILTANFVDFKGCVEKEELLNKVRLLWRSRNQDKPKESQQEDGSDEMCKVCMNDSIDCVLLECGHMVACINCSKQLAECPICRQNISRIVRVFKA